MKPENNNEKTTEARKKRNKDQFLIVLMGLVGYGFILIAIVIGTFFAVKNAFAKKDAEVAAAVEQAVSGTDTDKVPEDTEETQDAVRVEDNEPETNEETEADEHPTEVDRYMTAEGKLDYSQVLFEPGKRDKKLKWSDTVFSRIEDVKEPENSAVNSFRLQRKRAYTTDDHLLELMIYTNPDTAQVEKITTVEHCSDNLNIIDYYYDKGNINYAAEREALIDVPVDISSGAITSRYYFKKDTLVKYSYCENSKATVFSAASLDDYSEGTVEQYEYLESNLINKAYISYNAAKTLAEDQLIEGYILDEYDQALSDVEIKLYNADDMGEVARTTTDGDGHYNMSIPVNDDREYFLSAYKDSLDEVRIYRITARSGSGTYFVPTPRMTYFDDGAEYNEQIVVRDSLDNNTPIADASIRLRAGLNCMEGDVIASSVLDATGAAMFTLQSGNYTAEVSKGGYENSFFNVIITTGRPATVGYAVRDLSEDQLQVVLAWDTSPLDIDSRLIGTGAANIIKPSQDSVGALMTETVSLSGDNGDVYRYFVYDYSDITGGDANSGNMTDSGARVYVYSNEGLEALYNVPGGHLGVVWEPFMLHGKTVIPVNSYYNIIESGSYWTTK
ncbi:MAG: carboxypeptidase regulatory-like domain-containing protein [Lachnospiraceae bacterium]|nr:carboxypeptidase regulatory-like domain-containing protein [Lachnospiraceae bacterium]MBR6485099.1 carboxypeptidase regulatory-like domain-containing protein [Lachnospiraceae bacterium]